MHMYTPAAFIFISWVHDAVVLCSTKLLHIILMWLYSWNALRVYDTYTCITDNVRPVSVVPSLGPRPSRHSPQKIGGKVWKRVLRVLCAAECRAVSGSL